jgi:hypothetical protein
MKRAKVLTFPGCAMEPPEWLPPADRESFREIVLAMADASIAMEPVYQSTITTMAQVIQRLRRRWPLIQGQDGFRHVQEFNVEQDLARMIAGKLLLSEAAFRRLLGLGAAE